jgi:UDPglucose 6-dehydrogenase
MKAGSDNFRDAAILDIMGQLKARGFDIVIYEPSVDKYQDYAIDNDLTRFGYKCDLIIANRVPIKHRILFGKKLFTRDIFGTD